MTSSHTPDVRRNIARWAGKLHPALLAARLGLAQSFVERVAAIHNIDLRVSAVTAPAKALSRRPKDRPRNITANFSEADHAAMLVKAREHNLPLATTLAAIMRGALMTDTADVLIAKGRRGLWP